MRAIASAMLVGTSRVTNSAKLRPVTAMSLRAATSGSSMPRFTPGCRRFTSTKPRPSDTSEAPMNQASDLMPTRPTVPRSPILAMPTARVANTSGPMIILIRRRKVVVTTPKPETQGAVSSMV